MGLYQVISADESIVIDSSDDNVVLNYAQLVISGDTTFSTGDFLRARDGIADEWFEVKDDTSAPSYDVYRDKAVDYTIDTYPAWTKGTTIANYGVSGEGLIFMTASELNAPYLNVSTHAGEPWTATTTHLRLGNLNGFLDYSTDSYGIAIGTATDYLKYDPDNGLQIRGKITVTGGTAAQTFAQDAIPTSICIGDLWIDTDDGNKIYRAASVGADQIAAGEWVKFQDASIATAQTAADDAQGDADTGIANAATAQTAADDAQTDATSKAKVFRQSAIPTSVSIGDLWIDSDDSKLYRATNIGDDEITAGEWELQDGAVATGWSHASDSTKIDGGDIYTGTVTADKITATTLEAVASNTGDLTITASIKLFGDVITIEAGLNDDLDWTEDGTPLTADLDADDYTPTALAAEVQAEMRAAGDNNTTVTYSSSTKKITIANSTLTTLTFLWSTGTNASTSCGKVIGFSVTADDTGALTYTADNQAAIRIELGELS